MSEVSEVDISVAPMTMAEAERITTRIDLRLSSAAENYTVGMQLIREAVEGEAWKVMGYKSPGAYIVDKFGESLAGLGFDQRQLAAKTMTDLGMSTRAIAPVLGVSQATVSRDARDATESKDSVDSVVVAELVEDSDHRERSVHSLDGRTRTVPLLPQRRSSLPEQFRRRIDDLFRASEKLIALTQDDRFKAHREALHADHWRQLQNIDGRLYDLMEFTLVGKDIPED